MRRRISGCTTSSPTRRGRPPRCGPACASKSPFDAVARQYCGALGKIANCQVAVSTAVLTDDLTWPTTLELYLPKEWAQDAERRKRAGIPRTVRFREKWRIALTHIRQVRAAEIQIDGGLA